MTAIAIYKCRSASSDTDELWAVGDTLITAFASDGAYIGDAISCGTKIFTLPLRVTNGMTHSTPESVVDTTIGLAYAGNTTLGLNLHAMLSQILPFLDAEKNIEDAPVSMEEIASFASKLLTKMIREINFRNPERKQVAEFAVFGFCPSKQSLVAYRSEITKEEGLFALRAVEATPRSLFSNIDTGSPGCMILGDQKKAIEELISARLEDLMAHGVNSADISENVEMAPKYVLEALIHHNTFKTIGRGVQIVVCDDRGARAFLWQRPQSLDAPSDEYEMYSLFNISVLDDIPRLGRAALYNMPSVRASYNVDLDWKDKITEFQAALRRLGGAAEPYFVFSE